MFLNLLHRPGETPEQRPLFALQQEIAHELRLKVTLLVDPRSMQDEDVINDVKRYAQEYGDELGIWFNRSASDGFEGRENGLEPIWLCSEEEKAWAFETVLARFYQVFRRDPVSVGAYHLDAGCLRLLKSMCPAVKVAVAGCFEEGVRVFHGCNNSWYLFNEGMPWGPWYPSQTHSLRPAVDEDDAVGIVAVPHLCRDLVLSYEGRNDFFATHPANVQRAMANEGANCPYMYNLVDQYRLQEDHNEGFSYCHVFVGAAWLSNHHALEDPDEVTQELYREFLEYFVELRERGELVDMYMSEFAGWYRENVPLGKPQVALAKDMLYGSGKHYFWYIDPYCRVTIDAAQGGAIGDLRPYAGQVERFTGPDSSHLCYGSYPYVIQSQYRSGMSHHFADGARTTLLVTYQGETVDLGTCRTRCADVRQDDTGIHMRLTPARVGFRIGLTVSIETTYHFAGGGRIGIERRLVDTNDPDAVVEVREYFKGCYGTTEYPEDMHDIELAVMGDTPQSLVYAYRRRAIRTANAEAVSARIPQISTEIRLEAGDAPAAAGQAVEGYLFSPYYTLTLENGLTREEAKQTWLIVKKMA